MFDYQIRDVRDAAILTSSYVAGTVIEASPEHNQLVILLAFTIGSLTSAEVKVEYSHDNSTYYQETASSVSGGTDTVSQVVHKVAASGNYQILVPVKARYIKISINGTGTATSSSAAMKAVLGTV